jgi:hypothetical protein
MPLAHTLTGIWRTPAPPMPIAMMFVVPSLPLLAPPLVDFLDAGG